MVETPFPLAGTTLVTGPSNVGKTRLTARAFDAWVAEHGTDGVVVLDFAPEIERDGRLLGCPTTSIRSTIQLYSTVILPLGRIVRPTHAL